MGESILMFATAIGFALGVWAIQHSDSGAPRIAGIVITCGMLGVSTFMQMSALLAQWGVLGDAMTFVATIAGCAALVGGVTYYIRNRPQQFDTEPVEQAAPQTQQNFVTPGVYASAIPALKRRGRI